MKKFQLKDSEYIPLCDLMKLMDLAPSGAVAKHLIANGKVKVDGETELRKRCKIKAGQVISYGSEQVEVI